MTDSSKIFRVAVIGPESTGKSLLCEGLAAHYKTVWVPEFAREYLSKTKGTYALQDIVTIYKEQYSHESELTLHANKLIFTDTEAIIAKVWCEHVYGFCPDEITQLIQQKPYDFYLLTSPDLPWEPDPLRENPGKGEFFFKWYKNILNELKLPYGTVSGIGERRLKNAIHIMEQALDFTSEKNQ
jgi:NadR type nicotinamide-nucleotide adenylyltransferase